MPDVREPNMNLPIGWDPETAESGWGESYNEAMAAIGSLSQLSVIDRDLSSPPGSPSNGDRYIVADTASGAWEGQEGNVAVWLSHLSAWVFFEPRIGWRAYVEDEEVLTVYKSTGWSAGISI